jgi:5'-deoxynucleotidase YfbR-like HD superfamily hydrolase
MSTILAKRATAVRMGGDVKRYHALRTVGSQNVAQHSYGVAWWCALLTDMQPGQNLLLHALAHDVAEAKVGDIPSPVKRALGASESVQLMEAFYMREYELELPPLSAEEEVILKLADCLDGVAFCMQEVAYGNAAMAVVASRYGDYMAGEFENPALQPTTLALAKQACTHLREQA